MSAQSPHKWWSTLKSAVWPELVITSACGGVVALSASRLSCSLLSVSLLSVSLCCQIILQQASI